MSAGAVMKIENGVLALALVGPSDPTAWQTPGGETIGTVSAADYATNGGTFSCQVTSGALNASPNTSDDTTPATFCEAEVTTTVVGVTSYTLDVTFLQDPHIVAGFSRFLFEHDTELAYFLLGLDGENPPKCAGRLRLVAGTIGGDARTTLTADLSLPVERKPDAMFGDSTDSDIVIGGGVGSPATGANQNAGGAGTWTPGGATPPATVAALIAGTPNPVVAVPTSAWTTGSYMQTQTVGTGGRAHWNGTAWVSGAAT